jgi:hypothetical protein
MKSIGTILVILGLVLTIFTSVKFFTREKVLDLGTVEVMRDKPNYLNWSPFLGIALMGIGGMVLWHSQKE